MKIVFVLFLLVITFLVLLLIYLKFKLITIKDKKNLATTVDSQIQKFLTNKDINAMVVGIVKNGATYIKGYGTILKNEQVRPDGNTVFELASTSKIFTTSVLQILADNNELNINDTLQNIIGARVKLPQFVQNISLKHLATHCSGFPNLPSSIVSKMTNENNPYADLIEEDIFKYLETCNENTAIGKYVYSNFGMGLLGFLLQVKMKQNLETIIKTALLDSLQMDSTIINLINANSKNIVQGFNYLGNETPIWIDNTLTGAGSFLSSANDMVNFIKANLSTHETPVSKSLLKTHLKQSESKYALGWLTPDLLDCFVGNKNMLWHNGVAGGYGSFMAIDKVHNWGVIILCNKSVDITSLGNKLSISLRTQSFK